VGVSADLSHYIGEIARRLLGPENERLSTREQLRFGTNGSTAVEIDGPDAGKWYDHEQKIGGGPWELLYLKGRMLNGEARGWLRTEIGVDLKEPKPKAKQQIVATYDYVDERSNQLYQAVRYGPRKTFAQRAPDGNGGWKLGKPDPKTGKRKWTIEGVRIVPYHLDELVAAPPGSTIFIPEGEKDVDNLRARGCIATCNPMGTGKWRPEFAKYFRGHNVVALPDNDQTGREHARSVASNLAPVAACVRVLELPGLPEKGDVSDWLNAGGTVEQLDALVAAAPVFGLPVDVAGAGHEYISFGDYTMSTGGLHYDDPDDEDQPKIWLSAPFEVLALTRDARGNSWGKLLRWRDPDGNLHEWAMPSEALIGRDEVWRHFLDQGLLISSSIKSRNLLLGYLSAVSVQNRVQCVSRIGWQQHQIFVLPDETFGAVDAERVLWQTETLIDTRFSTSGSINDWRGTIASKCVGNSRLATAVSIALAAPLLDVVNDPGGGFHYRGNSQTGKTTAAHVVGSVWGGDSNSTNGYVRSWRATANGLEGIAAAHCDGTLCLDEIGQIEAREASEAAYMLSNGFGKGRANREGFARVTAQWRLLFLSTGEISLADKMSEIGRRPRAGQEVRLVDIPADAGAGLGLFENLHGASSAARFAEELRCAAFRYYGTPIRQFLKDLTELRAKDSGGLTEHIEFLRDEFLKAHLPKDASSQVRSVCNRFALVAAAGSLATALGITGWPDEEAHCSAATCFRAWLGQRGNAGDIEIENAIRQVVVFIEQHGNSRFESAWDNSEERIINRAGFRRRIMETQQRTTPEGKSYAVEVTIGWEYMVLPEVWRSEVLKGFDVTNTTKEMVRRRLIIPAKDASSLLVKVPKHGATRLYALSPEIISGTGNSGNNA
jgi:putative DNA primase/helicase